MDVIYGTYVPVFAAIYNWINEFKRGSTSAKDEHRSGLLEEGSTPKYSTRIKFHEIVEVIGFLKGIVVLIMQDKLDMKNIFVR